MSGFEVAGIVLGAVPIVIQALLAYREGKEAWDESELLLDEVIDELTDLKFFFHYYISDLLRDARVPGVPGATELTEAECIEIIQAVKTGPEIEQYLGSILFRRFLEIFNHHEVFLKMIVSILGNIVRLPGAANDDLPTLIEAHKSIVAKPGLKRKARFMMKKNSLRSLVKKLKNGEESLKKLVDRARENHGSEAKGPTDPTESAKIISSTISNVRASAASLYRAVCKCWDCKKHKKHTIFIRMEQRIPDGNDAMASSGPFSFRLCVPIDAVGLQRIKVVSRAESSSTAKRVVKFPRRRVSYLISSSSNGRSLTRGSPPAVGSSTSLMVPEITVTDTAMEAHPGAARVRIKNICEDAQRAQERGFILSLELTPCFSLDVVDRNDGLPCSYAGTISLADDLGRTAANADDAISPFEQAHLALNVASSLLQLRPTLWCDVPWTSSMIKFPVHAASGAGSAFKTAYAEHFVNEAMLGARDVMSPELRTETTKSTLIELAIMLLEIMNHQLLRTWALEHSRDYPERLPDRREAAEDWLNISTHKLGEQQRRAVQGCLTVGVQGGLLWDEPFQHLYCENIIKPLKEHNELTRVVKAY